MGCMHVTSLQSLVRFYCYRSPTWPPRHLSFEYLHVGIGCIRTQSVKAPPNDCNIIQHCWTIMHIVERSGQTNKTCLMQHLDSRVWDQNIPRILRKQTRAILVCPTNGSRPINLLVGPHPRFSWSYCFTYSFVLSLSI